MKYFIYLTIFYYTIAFCNSLAHTSDLKCGITDDDIAGDLRTRVPWIAAIFRKNEAICNWEYWKTGYIIGPSTIIMSGRHFWNISAAQQTIGMFPFRASDFLVGVGILTAEVKKFDSFSQFYKVESITPHTKSDQRYSNFDVALVHLKTKIEFSSYVRMLCVAAMSYSYGNSPFATIVNSTSLKVGFESDGATVKLYKDPVILGSYPFDSNCSMELKRNAVDMVIPHGDLPVKKCVDLDAGLAVYQLGAWYLTSVATGGIDPIAKSLEEWYFFPPLIEKTVFSWVQESLLCGPGNIKCYMQKCSRNCKKQEDCNSSVESVDNWCTRCPESGDDITADLENSSNNSSQMPITSTATTVTTMESTTAQTEKTTVEFNTQKPETSITTGFAPKSNSISGDQFCPRILETESVDVECYGEMMSEKYPVNCSLPAPAGTKAKLSCKKYFKSTSGNPTLFKTCKNGQDWTNKEKLFKCAIDCGISDGDDSSKHIIISGSEPKSFQWPWNANLHRKTDGEYKVVCAGTLIAHNFVISSANCIFDENNNPLNESLFRIVVSPTSPDLSENFNSAISQVFQVISLAANIDINSETEKAGISLLKLSSSVKITEHTRPVCFPYQSADDGELSDQQLQSGSLGYISKFGLDENLKVKTKLYELVVVNEGKCRKTMQRKMLENQFCAGYTYETGSSPRNEDSGKGLVFRTAAPPYKFYIQGILSNGNYTIFTKVGEFSDWVSKRISQ